jgi:hypothetical protein
MTIDHPHYNDGLPCPICGQVSVRESDRQWLEDEDEGTDED